MDALEKMHRRARLLHGRCNNQATAEHLVKVRRAIAWTQEARYFRSDDTGMVVAIWTSWLDILELVDEAAQSENHLAESWPAAMRDRAISILRDARQAIERIVRFFSEAPARLWVYDNKGIVLSTN
jgi:hypothetical protein